MFNIQTIQLHDANISTHKNINEERTVGGMMRKFKSEEINDRKLEVLAVCEI